MLRASLSLAVCASILLFVGCATLLGLDEERRLGSIGGSGGEAGEGGAGGNEGGGGPCSIEGSYPDLVLCHSPVAYFRFEDEPGAVAFANLIDSNRPAQKEADVAQAQGILGGMAASFSGEHNAHAGDDIEFDFPEMTQMSIELWLNTPEPKSGLQQVVSKRFANAEGYTVTIDNQHRVTFTRTRDSMSTNVHYSLVDGLDYGRFIHVVATFSEEVGSRLFIDGEPQGDSPTADEVDLLDNGEELEIGGDAGLEFTGRIDELALYAHELELTEIQAHFALGQP